MNKDEIYSFHLVYYFIVSAIGGVIIYLGLKHPVYNTETAEIITPYSLPFIVFGIILIILSFIGMIFFCGDREYDY